VFVNSLDVPISFPALQVQGQGYCCPAGHVMEEFLGNETWREPTWWLIPQVITLVFTWINPTYPTYNQGYNNLLSKWDEPPSTGLMDWGCDWGWLNMAMSMGFSPQVAPPHE